MIVLKPATRFIRLRSAHGTLLVSPRCGEQTTFSFSQQMSVKRLQALKVESKGKRRYGYFTTLLPGSLLACAPV